jgi:periplasmic protein TonB
MEIHNLPGEQSMSVTINAFPPLHAFTSARSWFLAIIVLLHVGFFWALNSGLSQSLITFHVPPMVARIFDPVDKTPPPPPPPADPLVRSEPFVPTIEVPNLGPIEDDAHTITGSTEPPPPTYVKETPVQPRSMVTLPQIDTRYGLSEPLYPSQEIRLMHTGTVMLSVYVLENGRIGDVRLEQSSGYERLDESALREARKWRFKPGMRDGSPVAMWKQVPITFRLKD